MSPKVELSEDGRYVLMTYNDRVSIADINTARVEALPLFSHCDRTLVDFRQAKISHLSFIEIDDLGLGFKNVLSLCQKVAFVRSQKSEVRSQKSESNDRAYSHLVNIFCISGVEAELYETMDAARDWLLDDG